MPRPLSVTSLNQSPPLSIGNVTLLIEFNARALGTGLPFGHSAAALPYTPLAWRRISVLQFPTHSRARPRTKEPPHAARVTAMRSAGGDGWYTSSVTQFASVATLPFKAPPCTIPHPSRQHCSANRASLCGRWVHEAHDYWLPCLAPVIAACRRELLPTISSRSRVSRWAPERSRLTIILPAAAHSERGPHVVYWVQQGRRLCCTPPHRKLLA